MRIKWLIIFSALCIGIILIILMLSKQNIEIALLPENKPAAIEQTVDYSQPGQTFTTSVTTKSAQIPAAKKAITIIAQPAREPADEVILPSITSYESISPSPITGENSQPGITKTGKHPPREKSQEMQSKGIVLY
jgi:hypothetical protein